MDICIVLGYYKCHFCDLSCKKPLHGHMFSFLLCSFSSFSSATQLYPTLCDPVDCNTPGFPFHHQLPELSQIHVHPVRDATQPIHPLLSPSPPTFNLSQHQGLFQWVNSSHQLAKVCSFSIRPFNEYSALISFRIEELISFTFIHIAKAYVK